MIVDAHVHLLPGRLAEKVRAFFAAHMATEHRDHVQPFAYPIDHAAVLTSMAADGVDRVWSFSYAHKPGIAAGLNEAAATTAAAFASGPVEVVGGGTVHPADDDPAALVVDAHRSARPARPQAALLGRLVRRRRPPARPRVRRGRRTGPAGRRAPRPRRLGAHRGERAGGARPGCHRAPGGADRPGPLRSSRRPRGVGRARRPPEPVRRPDRRGQQPRRAGRGRHRPTIGSLPVRE